MSDANQEEHDHREPDDFWAVRALRKYFSQQKIFLLEPSRFVASVRDTIAKKWGEAVSYLLAAGAFSIALGKVNINLYNERVQRIATLPDVVSGQAAALITVVVLGVVTFLAFRSFGGHASLTATVTVLLYAVAFALPLITALLILVTRVGSAVLGQTLLFLPPTRIIGLGGPEKDLNGLVIAAVLTTFTVYWNLYFTWLIWAVLRELHGLGKTRAGAALLISVGGMYATSAWLGKAIEPLINISLPLWENLFK